MEGKIEDTSYYVTGYFAGCKTAEEASAVASVVKQQLVERMNQLNEKGMLKEQLLAGPVSDHILGEAVHAHATIRKTEDGKVYIERNISSSHGLYLLVLLYILYAKTLYLY